MRLRPHHLLCLPRFRGSGYDERFVEKAWDIVQRLDSGEKIELVEGEDDLCSSCPAGEQCRGDLAKRIDEAVIERTGLVIGEVDSIRVLEEVSKSITTVEGICSGCPWMELCLEIENQSAAGPGEGI